MRAFVFEGTSDEIGSVMAQLLAVGAYKPASKPKGTSSEAEYVTVDFARRFLTREPPLPSNLARVLAMCAEAPKDGALRSDLRKAIGFDAQQFSGLMGALGKRVAKTEGYDDTWFIWNEWDDEAEDYRYHVAVSVIEAMNDAHLDS